LAAAPGRTVAVGAVLALEAPLGDQLQAAVQHEHDAARLAVRGRCQDHLVAVHDLARPGV